MPVLTTDYTVCNPRLKQFLTVAIAQLAAHRSHNPKVASSILARHMLQVCEMDSLILPTERSVSLSSQCPAMTQNKGQPLCANSQASRQTGSSVLQGQLLAPSPELYLLVVGGNRPGSHRWQCIPPLDH